MSLVDRISNDHLLMVQSGFADDTQIYSVLSDVLIRSELFSDIYVNVVYIKGNPCKYAYVWVKNKEAFEFLVGFGDKGYNHMKKMVEIPNPEFLNKKEESFSDPQAYFDHILKTSGKKSWDEDEDIPPTIKVIQDGIKIVLKSIVYTSDQIKTIHEYDPDWEPEPLVLEMAKAHFRDYRLNTPENASSGDEHDAYIHNKWIARGIPEGVGYDSILNILQKYVSNPQARGRCVIKGVEKTLRYPHVTTAKSKGGQTCAYVTFDPDSADGIFALAMCRQMKIEKNGIMHTLYFTYQKYWHK
ncbi:MAG TPA: hypothetical protein VKR58_03285 [Aquella sp.]|nr:hypothetical protein [Aquella sp.]